MKKLCKEFYNYNEQCKILPINFVEKYVKCLIKIYNASSYVKNIELEMLPDEYFATYSFDDKRIRLCCGNLKEQLEDEMGCKFDVYNQEHVTRFNTELIFSLSHECYHAIQLKCIKTHKRTVAAGLFLDSIKIGMQDSLIYDEIYKYLPTEINAEILGKLFSVKFVNLLANSQTVEDNNAFIAAEILMKFIDENEKIYAPTEVFYTLLGENKRYNKLLLNSNLSNYKKMILGLKMDDQYLSELLQLSFKEKKTDNIKRYLKNK